jgi:transposase
LIAWLGEHKIGQVHACLEATGRHSLGIALALHEAGHVVSIVNPAQIRDFARTKLGRNKTDQVDAVHIREYAELFKPRLDSAFASDEAFVRTPDNPGWHGRRPDGMEESPW